MRGREARLGREERGALGLRSMVGNASLDVVAFFLVVVVFCS